MHVEISVALNFVISYLYNKLPRRRVDLFGEELEMALKKKFEGHWYPDRPNKGSGFRCIKANGDEIDSVLTEAAVKAGLDISEVRNYLPDDLTIWIDPSEVSYKIGEKAPVKVLYDDRKDEDLNDTIDREVQAANRTFNPEAQAFTPEGHTTFAAELLSFSHDVAALCAEPVQTFQPVDSLSSSLSNLSLSPSSPIPPGTWSTTTSPSSTLFSSAPQQSTAVAPPTAFVGHPQRPVNAGRQQFTAAAFAQTKFGSTKLKTQIKRPNRLSPTEFGNFFRQQQRSYAGPPRPRSLSPRDPRVEFLMDQQQRMYYQQQHHEQQQQHQQMSPSMPCAPQFNQQQQFHQGHQQQQQQQQHHQQQQHQQQQQNHRPQQQLSPTGWYPDFLRQHSSGVSSTHSSPHLSPQISPHMSPGSHGPAFQDLIQTNNNHHPFPSQSTNAISRPNNLGPAQRPMGLPGLTSTMPSPSSHTHSQAHVMSPEAQNSFVDGLGMGPGGYSNSLQHLLMAN